MLQLSRAAFRRARIFVKDSARSLDQTLFAYHFEAGAPADVLAALAEFQNADGGFGRGIEPDFALPASSAAATAVGFEYLQAIDAAADREMVVRGVDYLLATFDHGQQKWHAVPREVNDAPHAPWWHYHQETGGCLIDRSLGNPSAELIGYLQRYRDLVPPGFLRRLTASFVRHLHELPDSADSMHEILCYARMARNLPPESGHECLPKLRRLVGNATETDPAKWDEYCASPSFFVTSKDSPFVDLFPEALSANLDYLIRTQEKDGSWQPNWSWGQYEEAWPRARRAWSGHLTVRNLKLLSSFDRIER